MIKLLRSKKAMTLVELIATLLILILIVGAVSAIVAFTLRAYDRTNTLAETNILLGNLSGEILNDFRRAVKQVTIDGSKITIETYSSRIEYDVEDGILYKNDTPVFMPDYYKGKKIGLEYYDISDKNTKIGAANPVIVPDDINEFYIRITIFTQDTEESMIASGYYAIRPMESAY